MRRRVGMKMRGKKGGWVGKRRERCKKAGGWGGRKKNEKEERREEERWEGEKKEGEEEGGKDSGECGRNRLKHPKYRAGTL